MAGLKYGIKYGVDLCVAGGLGTYFYRDADGITLGIDEVIELGFSDRYFEFCSDGKLEGFMTGVIDVINYGVGLCIADKLGTGFDGYADKITLGFDK